jgi:hypothetical protein
VKELRGHVDSWSPKLEGWVYDAKSPDKPLLISVLVDDVERLRVSADLPRPDVAASGHLGNACGFSINLAELISDSDLHTVRVFESLFGVEIFRSEERVFYKSILPVVPYSQRGLKSILKTIGSSSDFTELLQIKKKLAIVSVYREPGSSSELNSHLFKSLRNSGFVVLAVDTSEVEPTNALDSDLLLWRNNLGWDFASWHAGIDYLEAVGIALDQLLLTNDSCYGPLAGLDEVLAKMDFEASSVWSLTDGFFGGYHLQSNFLIFGRDVLESKAISKFFDQYKFYTTKNEIVREGEIGFSRFLMNEGFKLGAVFRYEDLLKRFKEEFKDQLELFMSRPEVEQIRKYDSGFVPGNANWLIKTYEEINGGHLFNTTHTFWQLLLGQGFPFVKRDLLTSNSTRVANVQDLVDVLRDTTPAEIYDLIRSDIKIRKKSHFHVW